MKVYFNEELIKKNEWIPFLNPILGNNKGKKTIKEQELERTKKGKNLLVFSNIEYCDYVVFPKWYFVDAYEELKKEANYAKKYGKKIIVFYHSDNELPINIDNTIIFRSSLSTNNPSNEYCYPPIIESIYNKNFKNKSSNLNEISIGYTGYYCEPSKILKILDMIRDSYFYKHIFCNICLKLTYLIKDSFCKNPQEKKDTLLYFLMQKGEGKIIRYNVINKLKKSKFDFKFIERKSMLNPNIQGNLRNEYIENIYSCTFPLVVRGNGNYSYRLYEVMSAGKIPLFIDTNCRLPFENEINYKELFIRIPYDDIKNIDTYIEKYIEKNKDLKIIENKIKNIYDNYIYFPNYCKKIINMLESL